MNKWLLRTTETGDTSVRGWRWHYCVNVTPILKQKPGVSSLWYIFLEIPW